MNTYKRNNAFEQNIPDRIGACPYLKCINDETIRYGFSHTLNFCHKPKKAQPIRLSYQKSICLNDSHTDCPIFQHEWNSRLPRDIRGKNILKRKIFLGFPLLIIILLLVFAILVIFTKYGGLQFPVLGVDILAPT